MNVLITSAHESGTGGVQVVLRNLMSGLEQRGHTVFLLNDAEPARWRMTSSVNAAGRTVYRCPMPVIVRHNRLLSALTFTAFLPLVWWQLASMIRRHRIDVINCHYLTPYFLHLVLLGRLLGVRVVISVHGADVDAYETASPVEQQVFRRVVRDAACVVACSAAMARQTEATFPDISNPVTFVHNGVDVTQYAIARRERTLPHPFLLCVCRHVEKKGVDVLLRAFARLRSSFPDVSLVLVGGGPLLDEHKALARQLGVAERTQFVGQVDHGDVGQYFEQCTVFVVPSRAEPFGVVLLEAAFYQKPIVATNVGGIPEIVEDGVNGALVPPDDADRMADQIAAFLREPARAAESGSRARETLFARFLWQDRITDYINVFAG